MVLMEKSFAPVPSLNYTKTQLRPMNLGIESRQKRGEGE